MAKFELNDDGVVVIIGSGAGGGTLAHELTRRGIKVVLFEAGKRQSLATFSQVPGEAFAQLTWLERPLLGKLAHDSPLLVGQAVLEKQWPEVGHQRFTPPQQKVREVAVPQCRGNGLDRGRSAHISV